MEVSPAATDCEGASGAVVSRWVDLAVTLLRFLVRGSKLGRRPGSG